MKRMGLTCMSVMAGLCCIAQTSNSHVISGNKFYHEEKFDRALTEYQAALPAAGDDPVTTYNLGNALFRNQHFPDAANAFDNSIANGKTKEIKQQAYYNKGVSLSKQNKLEESIDAYKMAVVLNPADSNARINLQKALLELKKKMPPTPEKKDEKKKKQPQQNKPQNKQSNMSKKEVEQRLKALQEREQQVQRKMQERNRTAGQQEKDW